MLRMTYSAVPGGRLVTTTGGAPARDSATTTVTGSGVQLTVSRVRPSCNRRSRTSAGAEVADGDADGDAAVEESAAREGGAADADDVAGAPWRERTTTASTEAARSTTTTDTSGHTDRDRRGGEGWGSTSSSATGTTRSSRSATAGAASGT